MSGTDTQNRLHALEQVLRISRDMAATTDLDQLLALIIDRSMALVGAERATLFLYDAARDEVFSKIAAGSGEIRVGARKGIVGAVVQTRQVLNIPDAYADARFNPAVDRQTGWRTRSIVAVPLLGYDNELVGVLEVLNKRPAAGESEASARFDDFDIDLVGTLAAQAGVALQRQRLLEHLGEKLRMAQAMEIARQIQADLLPRENPTIEGFDLAGWARPADETGGDMYDFFALSDGRWTITLADATGHGIGPALVIAGARAMLRSLSSAFAEGIDLSSIIGRVNDLLTADLNASRFVTCFFALLDSRQGLLRYVSAGQGPLLMYDRAADRIEQLPITGLPLGVMEGSSYDGCTERRMNAGDMLIVTTDGFFEAANPAGEQFGIDRIGRIVRDCRDRPSAEIIAAIRQAVEQFAGPGPQADDLTAILLKKL